MRASNGDRHPRLEWRSGHAPAMGLWVAARVRRLVLDRALKKTLRWIEHRPPADVCRPRDIGLGSVKTERLASHDRLLAADPFHITLKRNVSAAKPESKSQ